MKLQFLVLNAFCAGRLVSALSGQQELSNIAAETKQLDKKVTNWNGSPFSMFPIGLQAQKVKKMVDGATAAFQTIGPRLETDDNLVVVAADDALNALDSVINTVITRKEKFDQIPLGVPILFGILKTLQKSTSKLTQECINGASIGNVNKIKTMEDRAKSHFEKGMAAFFD